MESSVETLQNEALAYVEKCREQLKTGEVNFAGLEKIVYSYCQAIAELSKEEKQNHAQDLENLMQEVTALGEELTEARERIRGELTGLGKLKQANVAYQKSDAIGPVYRKKEED